MSISMRMDGDPAAIEHDINQTRARVDHVLEALQDKLSPRQLRAQARHFVEERSVRFAKRLGRNVRDNPWPVVGGVLIAIAWVALVRRRRRHREEGSAGSLRHWL
ncbi:MAG TPA: DUF3618 domain-containing protein [Steroidobacteraceae bacterium]|nr:DUF3618 domain-containing protein [Steroidobacteraceae bacterium]